VRELVFVHKALCGVGASGIKRTSEIIWDLFSGPRWLSSRDFACRRGWRNVRLLVAGSEESCRKWILARDRIRGPIIGGPQGAVTLLSREY